MKHAQKIQITLIACFVLAIFVLMGWKSTQLRFNISASQTLTQLTKHYNGLSSVPLPYSDTLLVRIDGSLISIQENSDTVDIPLSLILSDEALLFFKTQKPKALYSQKPEQAAATFSLLTQLGYTNIWFVE